MKVMSVSSLPPHPHDDDGGGGDDTPPELKILRCLQWQDIVIIYLIST
jgi:hypothetical protein